MKGGSKIIVTLMSIIFSLCSCGLSKVSPEKYVERVESSKDLKRKIVVGAIEYEIGVQTPEYMAIKGAYNMQTKKFDAVVYEQRIASNDRYMYITIKQKANNNNSVLKYNISGYAEYEERVKYYEFYAGNDLSMICNGKAIPPVSYQYENHLGLSPVNTIIAVFPKCTNAEEWQINFDDRALNHLFIKANFKQEAINSLPKIKY